MSNEKPTVPTDDELSTMSREELATLGAKLDGVELVEYPDPWPVKGTRAEKRAQRNVAMWFWISALAALAFIVVFIAWPWRYADPGHQVLYSLYTPLLGLTLGLSILGLGVAVLQYTRKFIPHELAVQDRHDGGSSELDKKTILAELADIGHRSTIARRGAIKTAGGAAVGMMGLGVAVLPLGGLIKNPWAKSQKWEDTLAGTGWYTEKPEEFTVFLRKDNGLAGQIELVRPQDMDAGGLQTVFPVHVPNDLKPKLAQANTPEEYKAALLRQGDTDPAKLEEAEELWEHNEEQLHRVDTPVMLIRLRPADSARVTKRKGQEDFNYGDYYAYTKICSHLGCPVSLFEQQTNRLLCPCHQSQFDLIDYCKPIFGPAARALAQLPIEVDAETGYLKARHDFIEPVGPAYWERKP